MKKTISTTVKAGLAALALVAASGCVSQATVDEIRATAEKAVQDAAAAKAAADAAASAAQSARSAADSAQRAANRAPQVAQPAQACCDATNEKMGRTFKRSVSKSSIGATNQTPRSNPRRQRGGWGAGSEARPWPPPTPQAHLQGGTPACPAMDYR